MPTATRTFRVFVSSTFEDLKAERDALQRNVFPKLRTLCEENGARFQAIDLRWGVRDEAALDQHTMEICLREIERCQQTGIKPNFIVLLGNRYGRPPLPARIDAKEFEEMLTGVSEVERRRLLYGEDRNSGSKGWYRRDDNAVPPEYILRPRELNVTADAPEEDKVAARDLEAGAWEATADDLRSIFSSSITRLGWPPDDPRRMKYQTSATHQEILKGLGATEEDRRHVFAFYRDLPDAECDPELAKLRRFLKERLPRENFITFESDDFAGLCKRVEEGLSTVITSQTGGFASRPALDLEIEAHDDFARKRSLVFGRELILKDINLYVRGNRIRPLILHGASGCGKSSIIARASEDVKDVKGPAVLVRRFIGASPESSNGLTLLRSLCEQIGAEYGATGEIPVEFNALTRLFEERLALATADKPLVVFLDALDQLGKEDPARPLYWLAAKLPPHCRVVVSTTELAPALNECELREIEALHEAKAGKALDHWLAAAKRRLTGAQREKLLVAFNRCGLPLYLKLAFDEARLWPSSLPPEQCQLGESVEGVINTLLDRLSLDANHGQLLVSRSLGYLAAARFGLTEDEMLDVLSEDAEVWKDFKARAHHSPPEHRLPVVVWSRLFLDLEPYLAERSAPGGTVVSFYHRQLAERISPQRLHHADLARNFASQSNWAGPRQPNRRKLTELVRQQIGAGLLAECKETLTDLDFVSAKCAAALIFDLKEDYRVAIAALPGPQAPLNDEEQHAAVLGKWIEVLVECARDKRSVKTTEVIQSVDLRTGLRTVDNDGKGSLRAFAHFVEMRERPLRTSGDLPGFPLQEAHNFARSGFVVTSAQRLAPCHPSAMLLERAPSEHTDDGSAPVVVKTLDEHREAVVCVAITADGRRIVSGGRDETIKLWDSVTGACLWTITLPDHPDKNRTFEKPAPSITAPNEIPPVNYEQVKHSLDLLIGGGYLNWVTHISITPKGELGVSLSHDNMVRVWNLNTRTCIRTLRGFSCEVTAISNVTPDGGRLIAGAKDGSLFFWDLEQDKVLATLRGHTGPVTSVVMTADGRKAISGAGIDDRTLLVWDLDRANLVHTLDGHQGSHIAISATPNGDKAISGARSGDGSIFVWNTVKGKCDRRIRTGDSGIDSLALTADGRYAFVFSSNELRIFETDSGECVRTLERHHSEKVTSTAMTPDGAVLVSGGEDWSLVVWNPSGATNSKERSVAHTADARIIATTTDGRFAVSATGTRGSGADGFAYVWDLESKSVVGKLDSQSGLINCLKVLPNGQRVVTGSGDGEIRIWTVPGGKLIKVLDGKSGRVKDLLVTPSGESVIAGDDKGFKMWDIKGGSCTVGIPGFVSASVEGDDRERWSLCPEGKRLVFDGVSDQWGNHSPGVFDLENGRLICTFVEPYVRYSNLSRLDVSLGAKDSVTVTPDGRCALVGFMKYGRPLPFLAYGIWDLTNGHIIKAEWQEVDSNHIMLSPDGRRVVSRDDNKATLRVFDFQTGKLLAILEGESAILERARFTPDGQRLIVGYSLYQSRYLPILRVWDLSTSECIAVYYGDHSVTGFSEINARGQFAYGTDSGKVFGVTLNEQEKHAPFVTPVRLWRLERGRRFWFGALQSSKNSGKWDDHLTVTCPWCGKRFPVKSGLTDVIQLISRDAGLGESHPPCLGLPYQAWDCPELRFECSNCERPLRSNPFVVDTRT